ncbi:MAG: hypothetical protein RLZZ76_615 [Candidatus Parcubacteria bacterium]|jgi:hypothetical protein
MIVLRIICALILLCSVVYLPLPVSLVLVCCYSFYFTAYELIIFGLCIDVFYGNMGGVPYYLLVATSIFVLVEWMKPRLLMYNR